MSRAGDLARLAVKVGAIANSVTANSTVITGLAVSGNASATMVSVTNSPVSNTDVVNKLSADGTYAPISVTTQVQAKPSLAVTIALGS